MATDPLLGTTVGGCEILEVIGQGGMGVIYRARQKSLDRVVALKVLARHLANDISFVTRFQREARAIAKVNHPNILAVYDVGDDQHTNYMIMELIEGRSLAELQADRRGAIPWEEAADYVRQAGQGLEAAQAVGIIHRDIKPENLMVTKKNVIKVSDFGLAKESDGSSGATSVDAVMGTPAFMSPEQCDGKKVDGRSDIYSLGGTFYRLVTGRLPFEAETAMSMMYRHKHEALIPPHEIVNTVPAAVSAVIVKMMAKKREHRFQTMTEVIDAIDAARKPAAMAAPPAASARMPAAVLPGVAPAGLPAGLPADALLSPIPAASPAPPMGPDADEHPSAIRAAEVPPGLGLPPQGSSRVPGGGGFVPASDSSSRLSMPSSIMGVAGGMGAPDESYTNVSRGDELLARGDRIAGLRLYRQALQSPSLDQATRTRIELEMRKELTTRRQSMEGMLKRGMLVEASRECRVLADLDPANELLRDAMKDLDQKLSTKRTLVNDIRTAIASSLFEKAIKVWDSTPVELRDEGLGKQIEQLRSVVVPALKLAQQAENFSRQGRLEEAMSSFEDAMKINPNCEAARQGQKDTEQKLSRIEYMLKEGFQYSLEQNYVKAIETWKPILALRPGHAQAMKIMVDAHVAYAQHLRAHGDLEGALAAYQGACETDAQNRSVRRMLEEVTNLRDKEQALVDRAQDAAARNRLSAAIGYWKEVLRINPASKKAAQQLQQLGGQRSRGLLKATLVLAVLGAAAAAGYQYYNEMRVLSAAEDKMHDKQADKVAGLLTNARFIFFKVQRQRLLKDAGRTLRIADAKKEADRGNLQEAVRMLDDLAHELEAEGDKAQMTQLTVKCVEWNTEYSIKQGVLALQQGRWSEAAARFADASVPQKENLPSTQTLVDLRGQADLASALALRMTKADGLPDQAARLAELQEARGLAEKLKFPEVVEQINKRLALLNFDPEKFKQLFADAREELAKATPDLAKARSLLEQAMAYKPDPVVKQCLEYLDAADFCSTAGMSLFAGRSPARGGAWGGDERRAAFCIDRYEWPNRSGTLPEAGLTWLEARGKCENAGKKLCSNSQWEDACKGPERAMFSYGAAADSAACNTESKAAVASGSKTACRNSIGVYDMSGNLAEWTDKGGDAEVRGGAYDTPARQASCIDVLHQGKSAGSPRVGFRCCRALPEAPPARP